MSLHYVIDSSDSALRSFFVNRSLWRPSMFVLVSALALVGVATDTLATELKYSLTTSLAMTFPDVPFANPQSSLQGQAHAQFSGTVSSSAGGGGGYSGLPNSAGIGIQAFDHQGPSQVSIGMQFSNDGNVMSTGGSASADLFSPNAVRGYAMSNLTAAAVYTQAGGETLPFAFGILPTETMPTFATNPLYFANFSFNATSNIPGYEQLFQMTVTSEGGALSATATSNPLLGLSTADIIAAALSMFTVGVDADGHPAFIATGGTTLFDFNVPVPANDTNAHFNLTLGHTLNVPEPSTVAPLAFAALVAMAARRRGRYPRGR
jgi:hypothetical protein